MLTQDERRSHLTGASAVVDGLAVQSFDRAWLCWGLAGWLGLIVLLGGAGGARAQVSSRARGMSASPLAPGLRFLDGDAVAPPPDVSPWSAPQVAMFAGGAATAFAAHESCHVLAGLMFGGTPRLQHVTFLGFVPFFAIAPGIECTDGVCTRFNEPFSAGTKGAYAVVSAGLQCQHLGDELMLSLDPQLRERDAPFRKGMLAFNTLTSVGYVLANWLSVEPRAGDVGSITRLTGASRGLVTGLLLGTAALDVARYYEPDVAWLIWTSRVAKVAFGGLWLTF